MPQLDLSHEQKNKIRAAESGYIPGILYQMSRVYKPRELSLRIGFLLCMASLSGIISGPIAYATSFLDGRNGMHGWQYLFILEGVPTVVLSILSYLCLFDHCDQVHWLTDEQKQLQRIRMSEGTPEESTQITRMTFYEALVDWKTWMFATVYMLNAVNVTSMSIFSPVIIDGKKLLIERILITKSLGKGFGFSVLASQLMTAPPYLVSAIMVLIGGKLTDRYNRRAPMLLIGFSTMAVGYAMLTILKNAWGKEPH